MPDYYENQHVIITGGSSGIGKATAKLLAAQGAHVSIIARNADRLSAARDEIEQARAGAGQRVRAYSADVSVNAEALRAVNAACADNGAPDFVITSAGMVQPGLFKDQGVEWFEKTMQLNYLGTVYTIKAALPGMLERRRGHIALISSGAGVLGLYGYTTYSPTKFALRGLAQALRSELKPSGIRVSVVYPSDVDTPQLAEENKTKPEETKRISGTAAPQQPDVVARAIVAGMRANRFAISSNMEMRLLKRLSSLVEPVMNLYMDSVVAGVAKDRAAGKLK
ncbi:MAG: SDR family oxidoreductase [Chloroflexi bacterium]|nr:SDR family oxidoreductase [Chloroflexota bacterium]MCL5274919.1 SDR family oxidoreductase [Chloroflexota bacterium]